MKPKKHETIPPINAIRKPLTQLMQTIEEQPDEDRLRLTARKVAKRLDMCLSTTELVREDARKTLDSQRASLLTMAGAAAEHATRGKGFTSAAEHDRTKKTYASRLTADATKQIRAKLGNKYATRAANLAKGAVETLLAYEQAVKRQKVTAEAPQITLSPPEINKLQFEFQLFRRWEPERLRDWARNMLDLSSDDSDRLRLRLILEDYLGHWQEKTPQQHARERGPRRGDDAGGVRGLEAMATALARVAYPDWLTFHDEELLPFAKRLFRAIVGVNPHLLSRAEFSRIFMSSNPIDELEIVHDWPIRLCDDDAVMAAAKMFGTAQWVNATQSSAKRERAKADRAAKPRPPKKIEPLAERQQAQAGRRQLGQQMIGATKKG